MKKRISKILWYGSEVKDGVAVAPALSPSDEEHLKGLNEGEIYISNSDEDPCIFIRTVGGSIVGIRPGGGEAVNNLVKAFTVANDIITPNYAFSGIQIGNGVLKWDEDNKGFYVEQSDGSAAGFYTKSYISALGVGSISGGSTGGGDYTVLGYADIEELESEDLTQLPSAYAVKLLSDKVTKLEDGTLTEVSWSIITGKPSWIGDTKPSYSYAEITGTPDLSVYALASDVPDTLPNPYALTFTGGSTATYDGSQAVTVAIPTSLKSPYSLTFGSKSYDGSAARTITAADLGALTSHQAIYALTVNMDGTKVVTYTPNSAAGTLGINAGSNIKLTASDGVITIANTYSYTHPSHTATTIAAATGRVLGSIIVNGLGHVTSVTYKTLAAGDIPTLAISKITGLQTALDAKLEASAFATKFAEEMAKWFVKDEDNKGIKPADSYGFYSDSYVSAMGVGTVTGGGSGTGDNYTVLPLGDIETLDSEDLTVIPSAYAIRELMTLVESNADSIKSNSSDIASLGTRVKALEGKATNVTWAGTLTTGTKIGTLTIDGTANTIYVPSLGGGASAESGKYVSAVTVSGHTVTVTKASLPTSLKNPYALTIQKNGTTVGTYDGSAAKTVNVTVPTKVSELTNDSEYATVSELDARISDLVNGAPEAYDTLKEIADVLSGNVDSIGDIMTTLATKADKAIKISAGTGLTGGGTLEANRTISLATVGTAGTYRSVTVDAYGRVTAGTNPTTLSGYGITDAKISNGVITLGTSTITPLTAASSLAWAKLTGKPTTVSGYGITDAYTKTETDTLLSAKANNSVTITAGNGLTGGGTLAANRTISVASANDGITVNTDNIQLNAINNLTSTSTTKPLSANQGKVLNTSITNLRAYIDQLFTLEGSGTDADPYVIKANYGLYTESFLSALGLGSVTGESGSGGSYSRLDAWEDYAEGMEGYVLSAALGYDLHERVTDLESLTGTHDASIETLVSKVSALEGGSALTVNTTGTGNAVTAVSKSGTAITVTKGTTFLTSHQTVSNKAATLAWGSAVTVATIGSTNITVKLPSNPNTNTTYTFAGGTNGFTVTPSGGSAQTVSVTPSITNNVTYSGTLTSGQLAVFDGTAGKIKASGFTIATSVPSGAVFTDTKNTAGSTDSSSKLFLIGATSQGANPQTYSHDTAYIGTDGCLYSGGTKVLTAHQTIYNLTMQAGAFSAVTFDPNGAAKTVNIPTTTSHISEGSNLYFTNARAQAAVTGGASTIVTSNLTASRALISNSSGKVAVSSVTSTELGYLSGVTSAVQTQINAKLATSTFNTEIAKYVKKAGDTMSGQLDFSGTTYPQLYGNGTYLILSRNSGTANAVVLDSASIRPYNAGGISTGSSNNRWSNSYSVLGNFSGQVTLGVADGTAPLKVTSKTMVSNLNSELWGGRKRYYCAENISATYGYLKIMTISTNYIYGSSPISFKYLGRRGIDAPTHEGIVTIPLSAGRLHDIKVTGDSTWATAFYLYCISETDTTDDSGSVTKRVGTYEVYWKSSPWADIYVYDEHHGQGITSIEFHEATKNDVVTALPTEYVRYHQSSMGNFHANATTATTLQTTRTLWGQSFNGSGNVTGSLSNVGNVVPSADATYSLGSSSYGFNVAYTNQVFSHSGQLLKLVGVGAGIYFRYNNQDATSLYLSNTAFRPFDAANGVFNLGTSSGRWNGIYGKTLDLTGAATVSSLKIGDATITWDSTNKALKVDKSVYSTGGVSALGAGNITSDTSGTGGSYSVVAYADITGVTSEDLTEIPSAYALTKIASRVASLEGGSALSVTTTGTGNVVSAITKSGTAITVTKGVTALTAHQSIYALTVKNSAGTTQVTYTPNKAASSLTLTKAMVGLGNVENTALSTWTGSTKITTLGTIATGTWTGSVIANDYLAAPSYTGTGASGTWGISISGNAATATNATKLGGVSSGYYNYFQRLIYGQYNRLFSFQFTTGEKGQIVFRVVSCDNRGRNTAIYAVHWGYTASVADGKAIGIKCVYNEGENDRRAAISAVKRTTSLDGSTTIVGAYDIFYNAGVSALNGTCEILSYPITITFLTRTPILATADDIADAAYTSAGGALYSGTFIGSLQGNATSASKSTYSDYVRITDTEPTAITSYCVPFVAGTTAGANYILRGNDGFVYRTLEGTASKQGWSILALGNTTATGTAGNKQGAVRFYSTSTGYTELNGKATTSNNTLYLPAGSGSLVYHTNNTAIGSSTLPVYVDSTGKVTACNSTLDVNINGTWKNIVGYTNGAREAYDMDTNTGFKTWAWNVDTRNTNVGYFSILKPSEVTFGLNAHGTIITAGAGDTHMFLGVNYSSANGVVIGAGNADKVVWAANLIHSANYTTYLNNTYVNVSGDTMTGDLTVPNLTVSGNQVNVTYGKILLDRAGTNYIWGTGDGGNIAIGLSSVGATSPQYASLYVQASALTPGTTRNNAVSLGSSSYRWSNVYSVLGNFSGQITSSVATGTAPFVVASTTAVSNLNADLLDGWHRTDIIQSGYVESSTASLSSYWGKLWSYTTTSIHNDLDFVFMIHSAYKNYWGIVGCRLRLNRSGSSTDGYTFSVSKSFYQIAGNLIESRFRMYYTYTGDTTAGTGSATVEIWANVNSQYGVYNARMLASTTRTSVETHYGTFTTSAFTAVQTPSLSNYIELSQLANTSKAATLSTSRTLWGQSFDGSANVSGDMTGVGSITASGNVNCNTLTAAGATTLKSTLTVTGNVVPASHGGATIGTTATRWNVGYFKSSVNVGEANTGVASGASNTTIAPGYMEISGSTPFIDFHHGNTTTDYTNRIIEGLSGQLTVTGKLRVGLQYTTSTDYNFYVNGTAYANGTITSAQNVSIATTKSYQFGGTNVLRNNGSSTILSNIGSTTMYFRPCGDSSTTGQVTISSAGLLTAPALTSSGATTTKTLSVSSTSTFTGLLTANGNIKAASYINIGSGRIEWDSTNSCLKVVGSDGSTACSIYATGGMSALGEGTVSGSGSAIDLSAIGQSIIPKESYTYNLGSSDFGWDELHAANVYTNSLNSFDDAYVWVCSNIQSDDDSYIFDWWGHANFSYLHPAKTTAPYMYLYGESTVSAIQLLIGANTYSSSYPYTGCKLFVNGNAYSTGSWASASDITRKNVLEDVKLSIDQVADAPAFKFTWKEGVDDNTHAGTSAQYWKSVLPEVVSGEEGDYSLAYGELALLASVSVANGLRETKSEVERLKERVEELEAEIERLRNA